MNSRTCFEVGASDSVSLTPRERARGSRMRLRLGMNTDHTLEERLPDLIRSASSSRSTRERIRQIEAKALRKLKHPSRSRKLRSFLDN